MPKPDPAFLDPARYPFHCRIEPRFGDLDVNLHINNVAMATMLEDARVRFHRESGYREALAGLTSMVASTAIEYLGEGAYPDPITLHVAVEDVGRTSHRLVQFGLQRQRPVVFARTVLVAMGPGGPAPVPAAFAEAARRWKLGA